jgi:large subunit ribosomal protein L10
MAGAMKASMAGAAALFVAPLAQTARLVEALRAKTEEAQPQDTAAPAAASDVSDSPAEAPVAAGAEENTAEAAEPAPADQG